jgi:toxin-antitoxin system, antitoxin component, xre family
MTIYNKDRDIRIDYTRRNPMGKEIYNVEGIEIEVEKTTTTDKDSERHKMAYAFKMVREQSGMNRKDFSDWLGIPYRTMQEWELGRRVMPEYVLRLIAYKVANEKLKK